MPDLDEFLMPVNSPIAQNQGAVSAYQFDYGNESGVISTRKVRAISADKITAGTFLASMNLGTTATGTVILDGVNNRIVIHDGTVNRIVIGNV